MTEFNPIPEHGWTCFHCGEHFSTDFAGCQAARIHFGDNVRGDALCQYSAKQVRGLEDLLKRYQNEDTALHREIARLQSDHAIALRREEESGYAKGLRDAGYHELKGIP